MVPGGGVQEPVFRSQCSGASIQEPGGRGRMSTASGDLARGRSDRYRANQVLQGMGLVVVDSRESRREQERAG